MENIQGRHQTYETPHVWKQIWKEVCLKCYVIEIAFSEIFLFFLDFSISEENFTTSQRNKWVWRNSILNWNYWNNIYFCYSCTHNQNFIILNSFMSKFCRFFWYTQIWEKSKFCEVANFEYIVLSANSVSIFCVFQIWQLFWDALYISEQF